MSHSIHLFKTLFDSSKLTTLLIDKDKVIEANQESSSLFSSNASKDSLADTLRAKPLSQICTRSDELYARIQGNANEKFEWVFIDANQAQFSALVSVIPSDFLGSHGLVIQLTPVNNSALVPSSSLNIAFYQQAFELSSEAVLVADSNCIIRYVNDKFVFLTGIQSHVLTGTSILTFIASSSEVEKADDVKQNLDSKHTWQTSITHKIEQQDEVSFDVLFKALFAENQLTGYLVTLFDQAKIEILADQSKLQRLAYHDELTGLANRALFKEMLEHEINRSHRHRQKFAVLYLDLDRFKLVNDTLGHEAGDTVLRETASRLQSVLRKSDIIARRGGDEFVLLINQLQDTEVVAGVAEKIIREITKPICVGRCEASVGCSVGISLYPDNGTEIEPLLHYADLAMYRAKEHGGKGYFYFSEEMAREIKDQKMLEAMLVTGLENAEFVPFYQPIIDIRSGHTIGLECLARWKIEGKKTLSPIEFLPTLQSMGMLHKAFLQIMEKALDDLKRWKSEHQLELPLSVNISNQQFCKQETFEQIAQMIGQSGLKPSAVNIDITESTLQNVNEPLIEKLSWLQNTGFCVALDDFGTGYSSVKYLQKLPLDTLKIDRSFVRNIEHNPHDKVVVKAIIQLSKTLGIGVTAEGVETKEQKDFLEENGCFSMQGFYFSPPIEGEDIPQLLQNRCVYKGNYYAEHL